ncbi:hypothetical protein E4U53_005801 [Claviceps sorghi]|nr:hypothetical protein E4U53_005801 [Claviceps sorghi]
MERKSKKSAFVVVDKHRRHMWSTLNKKDRQHLWQVGFGGGEHTQAPAPLFSRHVDAEVTVQ